MCCPVYFWEQLPLGNPPFSLNTAVKLQNLQLHQLTEDVATVAAARQAARPSSFLQAAGGSTAPDSNRGPAGAPHPSRGGAGPPGGGRGRGRAPPRAPPVSVPNEDFDFEEMMKKFNKQSQLKVSMQCPPSSKSGRPILLL